MTARSIEPFGLIVTFVATPETATRLGNALLDIDAMLRTADGCLLHEVCREASEPTRYWVTEAFTDRAAHTAATGRPEVQRAAVELRKLLAEPPVRRETAPLTLIKPYRPPSDASP